MEKIKQENNLTIPNLLSALRLVLIPFYVWQYLRGHQITALIIFLIVQLTDLLDGMIARRFGQVTSLGKLLDPLADKLLLIAVLVCFVITGQLPLWVLIVILSKEVIMLIGGAVALKHKIVVQSKMIGKVATVLFAAMIILMLLSISPLDRIMMYVALATSLAALVYYALDMLRGLRDGSLRAGDNQP